LNDRNRNLWRDTTGAVGCLGWALIIIAVLFFFGWIVSLAFGLAGLVFTAVFKAFGAIFSAIFSVAGGILGVLISFSALILILIPGIIAGYLIARAIGRRREKD
jgi:hypothetical protein